MRGFKPLMGIFSWINAKLIRNISLGFLDPSKSTSWSPQRKKEKKEGGGGGGGAVKPVILKWKDRSLIILKFMVKTELILGTLRCHVV
jgi:hypothetical protein